MSEDNIRTVEVHGQLYKICFHDSGIVVQVIGTTYEIYENNRGGFEVNRVEGDGVSNALVGLSSDLLLLSWLKFTSGFFYLFLTMGI